MKAIKAPFKAIAKVSKGILKGVKKAFSAITKSSLGKALLIGATIYLGGAAFGLWNSPFQAINGAFVSGAAPALETATAVTEAGSTLATAGEAAAGANAVAPSAAALTNEAAIAETMTSAGAAGGGSGIINSALPPVVEMGTKASAADIAAAAKPGFFSGDLAKYGLIQAGAGALQGAFSPDAIDTAERQAELERENLKWRNDFLAPNFSVGQFALGISPSGQPLRDASGNLIYPQPQPAQPPQPVAPQGFIQATLPRR